MGEKVAEIIELLDWLPIDPILRNGDLVRLVGMTEFTSSDFLEGEVGVVTEILSVLPEDHEFAPHQADHVNVALPFTEGWEILERIPLSCLRRILTSELRDAGR